MSLGLNPTSVPSGILIRPTVWPRYVTNVTDRTDRTTVPLLATVCSKMKNAGRVFDQNSPSVTVYTLVRRTSTFLLSENHWPKIALFYVESQLFLTSNNIKFSFLFFLLFATGFLSLQWIKIINILFDWLKYPEMRTLPKKCRKIFNCISPQRYKHTYNISMEWKKKKNT